MGSCSVDDSVLGKASPLEQTLHNILGSERHEIVWTAGPGIRCPCCDGFDPTVIHGVLDDAEKLDNKNCRWPWVWIPGTGTCGQIAFNPGSMLMKILCLRVVHWTRTLGKAVKQVCDLTVGARS